jgi:hypothetical protein
MKPCDRAWCVLAAGVIGYDLFASDGQTLSEGVDRYLQARPRGTRLAIGILAIHLLNMVPERYDPLHWLFVTARLKHRGRLDVRQLPAVGT